MTTNPPASFRPYPPPDLPWVLHMTWHHLMFMHWAVDPDLLRPLIPPGLTLELFDGKAWIGVVPFNMTDVGPRYLDWLPYVSTSTELNVRTYVTAEEKPGVWFFSLDADNPLAVPTARALFQLPYFLARMLTQQRGGWTYFKSIRTHRHAPSAAFAGRYRPTGPVFYPMPGTLDHWLTARFCLYAANSQGRVWRCEIHHPPWPLQPAEARMSYNTMTEQLGFPIPNMPPLLHFAKRLDVVGWAPHPAHTGSQRNA